MSKKSKKAERKKKQRQERIRQEKHQRKVLPPQITDRWLDDLPSFGPEVSFAAERWLRGYALRTGDWVVGLPELALAVAAADALDPVVGPGEAADASPSERAQELAYQAMEVPNEERRMQLVKAALTIDPACVDALRMRICQTPGQDRVGIRARLLDLSETVAATLDQRQVDRTGGRLTLLVSARPFLRVLDELAMLLVDDRAVDDLVAVLRRIGLYDHLAVWHIAGEAFSQFDEETRWRCARSLREAVTTRELGRMVLDGLLALQQDDLRPAAQWLTQAFRMNPLLRRQVMAEAEERGLVQATGGMGLEAAAIAHGLGPLIDDLDDFEGWMNDGMPWMTDQDQASALATYSGPVVALLGLGESALGKIDAIDYRQAHGIEPEQREQLERMLSDPVFRQVDSQIAEAFAPIHAWRALAQIGDARSLPALFATLLDPEVSDWDFEELPVVIARFGAAALTQAMDEHHRRFVDTDDDESPLLSLQHILVLVAERTPGTRATVIERLRWVVADSQMNRATSRGSAIVHLAALHAVECLPLIEQAFADGMVDTSYTNLPRVRRVMSGKG